MLLGKKWQDCSAFDLDGPFEDQSASLHMHTCPLPFIFPGSGSSHPFKAAYIIFWITVIVRLFLLWLLPSDLVCLLAWQSISLSMFYISLSVLQHFTYSKTVRQWFYNKRNKTFSSIGILNSFYQSIYDIFLVLHFLDRLMFLLW